MRFIDTNIFIRYFTKDDPEKAQACFALFKRAESNETILATTEAVIAEVVYVLSSKKLYNLNRAEIRARLYPILSLPGLRLSHRQTMLIALDLYVVYPVDFEDALIIAYMQQQKISEIYSYDRGFDRVEDVKRLEP